MARWHFDADENARRFVAHVTTFLCRERLGKMHLSGYHQSWKVRGQQQSWKVSWSWI